MAINLFTYPAKFFYGLALWSRDFSTNNFLLENGAVFGYLCT